MRWYNKPPKDKPTKLERRKIRSVFEHAVRLYKLTWFFEKKLLPDGLYLSGMDLAAPGSDRTIITIAERKR
jgi:hypothetical protein